MIYGEGALNVSAGSLFVLQADILAGDRPLPRTAELGLSRADLKLIPRL